MKILFIKPLNSTFVGADETFLASHYDVSVFFYKQGNIFRHGLSQIGLTIWVLKNIHGSNVIFIWFADYHSWIPVLFARIFYKKSIVVIGGYDVAYLPDFGYGVFTRKFRGWCAKYAIRNSDYILPVARSLEEELHLRVEKIRGKVRIVPTGYDENRWVVPSKKRAQSVLTVGLGETISRMQIKGLDLFANVARKMDDIPFIIVGLKGFAKKFIEEMKINNLTVIGEVPAGQLVKYYGESKVYAQLSLREGLPNAVCEAMLCECIPVGTDTGGIPEAIGDCGFLVESRQVEDVVQVIRRALSEDPELGKKARDRIIKLYPERKRHQALQEIIELS